jgi:endonuclease YncB( thermonuclease family)
MFDIFLALAVLLGLVALIAFTPGDRLDRVVRSLLVCLIGAIVGGLLALVISASGLGGYPKDRVYAGLPEADDVIDGDTIRMGDVSLRLNGIDAPEFHDAADNTPSSHNQFCRNGDQLLPCGAEARLYLLSLVMKGPVICGPPTSSAFSAGAPREHQLRESFGRPIVQCNVHTEDGETIDLSERMVKDGYAVEFSDRDSPPAASDDFTVGCGIRPYSWRNNTALREAFLRPGPFTAPATELIGDCTGIAVSPP